MKRMFLAFAFLVVGLTGFALLPADNAVRYLGLGMAVTGVLILINLLIDKGGS